MHILTTRVTRSTTCDTFMSNNVSKRVTRDTSSTRVIDYVHSMLHKYASRKNVNVCVMLYTLRDALCDDATRVDATCNVSSCDIASCVGEHCIDLIDRAIKLIRLLSNVDNTNKILRDIATTIAHEMFVAMYG